MKSIRRVCTVATPVRRPERIDVEVPATSGGPQWASADVTAWVAQWVEQGDGGWPNHGLAFTAASPTYLTMAADEMASAAEDPYIEVTWNTLPAVSEPDTPAADATVATATPTLTSSIVTEGADSSDQAITYWFRLATSPDAETGQVVNSGWLDGPSWRVPEATLADGASYWWKVITTDGQEQVSSAPRRFRVNLRLGDQVASPYDEVGGLRVNLATGNAVAHLASPSFATVGGPVGVSFTYNSQAPPPFGLKGSYHDACQPASSWQADEPTLVRQDPQVDFRWGDPAVPGAGMGGTDYCVRWEGFITFPSSGRWRLGARVDDGVRIDLDGVRRLDQWGDGATRPSPTSSRELHQARPAHRGGVLPACRAGRHRAAVRKGRRRHPEDRARRGPRLQRPRAARRLVVVGGRPGLAGLRARCHPPRLGGAGRCLGCHRRVHQPQRGQPYAGHLVDAATG